MKKIIITQWDMQMGPTPLYQFPPEAEMIPKEHLLKIWAKHETTPDNSFVYIEENQIRYCSLLKKFENTTYFIILEITIKEKISIFQEVLTHVADDLLKNINSSRFAHVLSDTYKTIKNYSGLDDDQLFLRLFDDELRIAIFSILKQGAILKHQLKVKLENNFRYANVNLELQLAPFARLGIIQICAAPGSDDTICLHQDVFCARIPPKLTSNDPQINQKICEAFSQLKIFEEKELLKVVRLFQKQGVHDLLQALEKHNPNGLDFPKAISLLNNDQDLFDQLHNDNFIDVGEMGKVFLIARIGFFKINPTYILPILAARYQKHEISIDQVINQIKCIDEFEK
jgi:hypothetical protein